MSANASQPGAKRIKLSNTAAASPPAIQLPRYQPSNGATSVSSNASISRTSEGDQSLRITIKAAPSKLRQATSGPNYRHSDPYDDEQVSTASRSVRSTRNPRAVVEPDSDEDMEDDEQDLEPELEQEEEEEDDDDDDEDDDEEEDDAEGEDDEDEIAVGHPPPPRIQQTTSMQGKPKLKVSAPREGTLKSVEAKEVDEDDDELSDIDSDDEIQNTTAMDLDDDEEEELDEDEEEEEEDAEGEDDSELGSGSATPDLSKLTRRQRGELEDFDGGLIALSNEAKTKKLISAEEHVMRRAEMARRRKNLSEKRNEEEKIDTINKLLKKPAPKRRTRAEMLAAQAANGSTPGADGDEIDDVKPDPVYTRWVNSAEGSRLGMPVEWLQSPAGEALARSDAAQMNVVQTGARVMVEEVA